MQINKRKRMTRDQVIEFMNSEGAKVADLREAAEVAGVSVIHIRNLLKGKVPGVSDAIIEELSAHLLKKMVKGRNK